MSVLNISDELCANAYPGRGIIMGRSADDRNAVIAYFIMGRSENSRNRVFVQTQDGIRTQAFDPSKMSDPSLIIYHPVRTVGERTVVTNGDQTDTVCDALNAGKSYIDALRTRCFEPDGPNFTPRISGIMEKDGSFALSILKSYGGDPSCNKRFFYEYDSPIAGKGSFIHTYLCDGDPLPSFRGEPKTIAIAWDVNEFANLLWNSLDDQNKVSLFVRYTDLQSGEAHTVIKNKHES